MLNFDIRRTTRRCAKTERPFARGESYIWAILEEEEAWERCDFSLEAWEGPPEHCVAWWKNRLPERDAGKVYWAPNDVLLSYFEGLQDRPGREATRFVMALSVGSKANPERTHPDHPQLLRLRRGKTRTDYEVAVVELDTLQKQAIQQELAEQLFTDECRTSNRTARTRRARMPPEYPLRLRSRLRAGGLLLICVGLAAQSGCQIFQDAARSGKSPGGF